MKPEYLNDEAVIAAMTALDDAIDKALERRGAALKSFVVLCHTSRASEAGALIGCDCMTCKMACMTCKMALAETFGTVIGASATIQATVTAPDGGPAKAVH